MSETEADLARANRETSNFCRYKKTYYVAILALILFLILGIVAAFSLACGRKSSSSNKKPHSAPNRSSSIPASTAAMAEAAPGTSEFLQQLIAQI